MSNIRLNETGTLVSQKAAAGVFPVRIITEGKGSSGVYSAALLKEYASVFNGAPSFMNHPLDPQRPDKRDVTSIAGKIVSEVQYEERDGVAGLYADLKVDSRWQSFVEDYADVIGLSVYIEGSGTKDDNGDLIVESFNGSDPYRSVDIVVSAGRGGRVERAMESLRVIESSVGEPAGKPSTEASVQENKGKVELMEKEILDALKALTESLAPVLAFVSESKDASKQEIQGTADAAAVKTAVAEAVAAYTEKDAAIMAAGLLPSQVESIREAAKGGADVAPLIEAAVKVVEEAKSLTVVNGEVVRIGESASNDDFTVKGWA
jgi:hypothetical protein